MTSVSALCFGLLLTIGCGSGLLYLFVELIIKGAASADWLMVIAGSVLVYLFAGILVIGFLIGIAITFEQIEEMLRER